jgi:hypothetical protein
MNAVLPRGGNIAFGASAKHQAKSEQDQQPQRNTAQSHCRNPSHATHILSRLPAARDPAMPV